MKSRKVLYWFLLGAAAAAAAFAPLPFDPPRTSPASQTFNLDARQFSYEPSVIRVAHGDTVTINLTSTDVVHGLYLDGYGLSVESEPGQSATLTFIANHSGTFRFRCNVTCGAMHPFMIGSLTVGDDDAFVRGAALTALGLLGLALVPAGDAATEGRT